MPEEIQGFRSVGLGSFFGLLGLDWVATLGCSVEVRGGHSRILLEASEM